MVRLTDHPNMTIGVYRVVNNNTTFIELTKEMHSYILFNSCQKAENTCFDL